MIRKPKYHPIYKISLVGINFRERWNVVKCGTKDEIETYVGNFRHIQKKKREHLTSKRDWWAEKRSIVNESTQNNYLRKLWRKRHSESFKKEVLYRIDRDIRRWNLKLGPKTGDGIAVSYHFTRQMSGLSKGDIVILTKEDEMGNLYFQKIDEIDAPNPYVFNRENVQLGWILPIDP